MANLPVTALSWIAAAAEICSAEVEAAEIELPVDRRPPNDVDCGPGPAMFVRLSRQTAPSKNRSSFGAT